MAETLSKLIVVQNLPCWWWCYYPSNMQNASQGRTGSGNSMYYHTETETAVGWLVACLTSQQQASVSQGRICSDNFTCCHTEIEVADPTFYLTQSQYTDTGPTSPSADPITPGTWQETADQTCNFIHCQSTDTVPASPRH